MFLCPFQTMYVTLFLPDNDLLDQNFTTCKPLPEVGLMEFDNQWPLSTLIYLGLHFRGNHISCEGHWMTAYTKSDCGTLGVCQVAYQCLLSNTRHSTLPDSTPVTTCKFTCNCTMTPCCQLFVDIRKNLKQIAAPPDNTFLCEVIPKPGNIVKFLMQEIQ